ncbi:MAG: hypothetical protein O7C75_18700 [Verrucomicrobia bacterium]|nr:hypothetical protein [Verrucomicrobiota bacterium]
MLQHPSIQALLEKLGKQHNLSSILNLLGWDEQVNLPPVVRNKRLSKWPLYARFHVSYHFSLRMRPWQNGFSAGARARIWDLF